jgi:hypothetical protein
MLFTGDAGGESKEQFMQEGFDLHAEFSLNRSQRRADAACVRSSGEETASAHRPACGISTPFFLGGRTVGCFSRRA